MLSTNKFSVEMIITVTIMSETCIQVCWQKWSDACPGVHMLCKRGGEGRREGPSINDICTQTGYHKCKRWYSKVQWCSKRWAPGYVKMWCKSCVLLPPLGKQNTTFSPNFTQPGAHLKVTCGRAKSLQILEMSSINDPPRVWPNLPPLHLSMNTPPYPFLRKHDPTDLPGETSKENSQSHLEEEGCHRVARCEKSAHLAQLFVRLRVKFPNRVCINLPLWQGY